MEQIEKFRKDFARNVSLGVLSMAGQSLFILADTFFIANGVGAQGIAALNIVLPIANIINGIGWMLGVGGGTLFATSLGKGDLAKANSYFSYTAVFASIVGLLFVFISYLFSPQILSFLGASGEIYQLAKEYYDIFISFSVFFILNNMFITFMRNDHNPKLAMIAFSTGGLLNIILDYIFIFPLDMGMKGAAWASIFSPIASLVILTLHLKNRNRKLKFTRVTRSIKNSREDFSARSVVIPQRILIGFNNVPIQYCAITTGWRYCSVGLCYYCEYEYYCNCHIYRYRTRYSATDKY